MIFGYQGTRRPVEQLLTIPSAGPLAVSNGPPPGFLWVSGGCDFKFWLQPHILITLTPDKRIYNFVAGKLFNFCITLKWYSLKME